MRWVRGALVGSLGVLLGLQALRTFLTGLVWMIGEQLHPNAMGVIAAGVLALGLLAGVFRKGLGRVRAERHTALALTLLYLGALHVPDTSLRVGLSGAATMVWIWWFSAYLCGRRSLAAALFGGFSLDVAVHAFFYGLDLPFAGSLLGAGVIGALFAAGAFEPEPEEPCPDWGMLALAPWLFMQMEVLTNIARIRMATGLGLSGAVLVSEAGLAAGLIAMTLPTPGLLRAGLGVLAALALVSPVGAVRLLLAQAGLGAALAGALRNGRTRLWFPVALLLLVGMIFLFYIRVTWPAMPALAALMLAGFSLAVRSDGDLPGPDLTLALPLIATGLAMVALLAAPAQGPALAPSPPPGAIRFMTYNIHQAMDYRSLPSPERIARAIEAQSPDVVALQEVNRGWVIAGASDFVSWLERRLPAYHVVYGPMVGDLWGTVILSRRPVLASGYERFRPGIWYTTGYSWAMLDLPGCPTLVASIHLASGRTLGGERSEQMRQLLEFWNGRSCTVIMGDTNAEPESKTIQELEAAGFTDWLGRFTDPRASTWPADDPLESIDYIATTAEFRAVAAQAVKTLASDHRPVVVDLLPPGG